MPLRPGALANVLLVGSGGFAGSVCRYLLSGLVHRWLPSGAFPYGTLAVNVLGCLAIGALGGLGESRQFLAPDLRLFLFLGLLGGFTTFSTFGYETLALLRDGDSVKALLNVALHVIAGIGCAWAGYAVAATR